MKKVKQLELSTLEQDFIGDLSQDSHELWELYTFVRLYNDNAPEDEILRLGNELLSTWVERGWLRASMSGSVPIALTGEQFLSEVHKLGAAAADPEKGTILLDLTDRAASDVKWLAGT